MSDYKERFDKWQRDAKEKFEEIDKQLGLKDKIEEGARVVAETAQKGAERIKAEAEKTEVGKQAVKAAVLVHRTRLAPLAGDSATGSVIWSLLRVVTLRSSAGTPASYLL